MNKKYFFRAMVIMFALGMITMYFILNPISKKDGESNLPKNIQDSVVVKDLDNAIPEKQIDSLFAYPKDSLLTSPKDSLFTYPKDSLFNGQVSANHQQATSPISNF